MESIPEPVEGVDSKSPDRARCLFLLVVLVLLVIEWTYPISVLQTTILIVGISLIVWMCCASGVMIRQRHSAETR